MTSIPEDQQWKAIEKISVFTNIVGDKCSRIIMPFLCFTLAPRCRPDIAYEIKPCAETCERVKVCTCKLIGVHTTCELIGVHTPYNLNMVVRNLDLG